jgi:hypothetical protein
MPTKIRAVEISTFSLISEIGFRHLSPGLQKILVLPLLLAPLPCGPPNLSNGKLVQPCKLS